MSVEGKPKQIDQQPELPKVETSTKPPTDSEKLASHNLEREQTKAKKQDDAKIYFWTLYFLASLAIRNLP